jgi:8-oxo-dGTP pyrophosphatase MutT (NUDIX family)
VAGRLGQGLVEEAAEVAGLNRAETVLAAGGVVWRAGVGREPEVLLVHRPKYDDWTLPKGKLDAGEGSEEAALREVEEETGLRCALGEELASTEYADRYGRPKRVRYWAMEVDDGQFQPNHEVDEVRWLPVPSARQALTYDRDREVLDSFTREADRP